MRKGIGMLVLSRKPGEQIRIDDQIVITIVEIRGDKVKIGIDAPQHVVVHRQEVYEQVVKARSGEESG